MSDFTGPQRPSGEHTAEDPTSRRGPSADPTDWAVEIDAESDAPGFDDEPSPHLSGGAYSIQRTDRVVTEPLVVSGDRSAPPKGPDVDETAPLPRAAADGEPSQATQRIRDAWSDVPESTAPTTRPAEVKPPRPPLVVLPMVILLTGLAAFFSWVSAEPFWLYVGHEVSGTVTVGECHAEGFAPRCTGRFVPDSGGDSQPVLRISGDTSAERAGETVTGQVVSQRSTSVYIGDDLGLLLRWSIGLGAVVALGFAIAWAGGAWRFTGRLRAGAVTVSLAGPLIIWLGALALTW